MAHDHHIKVTIWQVGHHEPVTESAKNAYEVCKHAGINIFAVEADSEFKSVDVAIDAICGIGLRDPLRDDVIAILQKIENLQCPILAIDIPTGIDADTGRILGKALSATITVTFIAEKLGLLTGAGVAHAGEVFCIQLETPLELLQAMQPIAERIEINSITPFLKKRRKDAHKGLCGHVLMIGGDVGYEGAIEMAALAAMRVGAGLVTVATKPETATALSGRIPEIMMRGVSSTNELLPLIERADVLLIGPGLGSSHWSQEMWQCASELSAPMVVDADALNALAKSSIKKDNWILTPHPGEAARLLNMTSDAVQDNRLQAASHITAHFGGVCVLKGAGTLITAQDELTALCDRGNPGMATAGMGDVLSGVLVGLLAQGLSLFQAARLGVYIHAKAGDLAARVGERGMMATDLMPFIRRIVNELSVLEDKKNA